MNLLWRMVAYYSTCKERRHEVIAAPVATGLGLSVLCCLPLIGPLISPAHSIVYHSSEPVVSIFVAVLLDVIVLWLVLTELFLITQKNPELWLAVWLGFIVLGPWMLLKIGAMVQAWPLPHWISRTIVLLDLAYPWRPSRCAGNHRSCAPFQRIQRFAATIIRLRRNLWCYYYQPTSLVFLASARIEYTDFIPSAT